ncbi:non-ribosomal peptide synthetase/type I polyketide synthase [Pseudomarimonas salicorniae]|uniref:Amino acid adenylation domain-containing protein n=1 Tax=Pseudomarimonas salicorniae TaxID=2933270 RepID=A0ABT0GII4_9GAMM|nr:non-ribosomal peptide synthetase/type I polyketide synthase [Lysobacter sp. CAU 1642]MCK7593999.1 amino acid adenylation domain-containing protein [Lysobacter sp. CAU 1642]
MTGNRGEGTVQAGLEATTETIGAIWRDLLSMPELDARANLFEAGAHSLLVPQFLSRAREAGLDGLAVADVYDAPSVLGLARRLHAQPAAGAPRSSARSRPTEGIAIVGMSARCAGAENLDALWENLLAGVESLSRFSPDEVDPDVPERLRNSPHFVAARGVLRDVEGFDAEFFGISPREAVLLDPQQRMLLELSWHALEHAGIDPARHPRIGVYAGTANNQYAPLLQRHAPQLIRASGDFTAMLGAEKDFVATRIAHRLDLKGPAVTILTACSTGLVVVVQACEALAAGACDAALAGASTVLLPQAGGYLHVEGGMESADGRCRPFDAEASGTVFSNGGAVVVLKRLEDALADGDTIYAVIRGTGLNNDGGGKASFTAPSVSGQAAAIRMALDAAGVPARDVGYIEAHGTATALGDPIEISGLCSAFAPDTDERGFCWLGSVKGNIGHTWAAAGMFGLIKAALALHHGVIPASLHFRRANPQIDFGATPFKVCAGNQPWPRGDRPRYAGISSFGVGGTNAHVLLGEAPVATSTGVHEDGPQVLALSARSESAALALAGQLADRLERDPSGSLPELAYALLRGRPEQRWRLAVAAETAADAAAALRGARHAVEALPEARVVFLFPGQGSQQAGMAAAAYDALPGFARALDQALDAVAPHLDVDLRSLLLEDRPGHAERLEETRHAQPALFCIEWAFASWLGQLGLRPAALIGHSIGELSAACVAGVLTLEEAARLVCARGAAMWSQPRGAMLAARASAEVLRPLLGAEIEIAGLNAPELTVLAGPGAAIDTLAGQLEAAGIQSTRLRVSHGFHSEAMAGAMPKVESVAAGLAARAPRLPLYSCIDGARWPDQAPAPDYWARQLRAPVHFSAALAKEASIPGTLFVEVGPGQALSALARQHRAADGSALRVIALQPPAGRPAHACSALQGLAQLWAQGAAVVWPQPGGRRRVPLPLYPFARTRHWFERGEGSIEHQVAADTAPQRPSLPREETPVASRLPALRAELIQVFADACGLSPAELRCDQALVEQGLDSLSATQASLEIEQRLGAKLRFRRLLEDLDTVDKLAGFFDAELPADRFAPAPTTAASVEHPAQTATTAGLPALPALPAAADGTVQALVQQQLALMQQQLALLAGHPLTAATPAGPDPASAPAAAASSPQAAPGAASGDEPANLISKPFGASARITLSAQSELNDAQRRWVDDFTARYLERFGASREFSQRHRALMADPRVVTGFNPQWKDLVFPIVADRSEGARLWDIQGNEFIDLLSCFGANLLGYKPKAITEAMHAQLDRGIEVGPQHPLAAEVSALLSEFSGHPRVGFCNTGSEAVMGAMRIARTVTGRKTIAIFTNSYHGIFDEVLVRGTRQLRSLAAAPGILASSVENVLVLDYASEDALRVLRERGRELAAVMIEPVQNKYPTLQPRDFVRALREICDEAGCALIFDEVVTGFRLAAGGAQEFYGVRADICSYGKIIGGGLPMAAITGSAKWLDALDGGHWQYGDASYPEAGVTYFAGTYVRHPLALAAAKATLGYIKQRGPALFDELNARTQDLVDRLNAGFLARQAPVKAVHCASLWRLHWDEDQRYVSLFYYLARYHGLHLYEQFGHFVTEPMDAAVIDRIVEVFLGAVDELMELGLLTRRDGLPPPDGGKPTGSDREGALSPGQGERWLAANFDSQALRALNETLCLRLDGPLDVEALRGALGELQRRHAVFRLRIEADRPLQREVPGSERALDWKDLSQAADPDAALDAFAREAGLQTVELGEGPMIRMTLLRLDPQRHALHLVYSHLAVDGWAISVFLEELALLYRERTGGGASGLPTPGLPWEFARQEQARMAGPDGQADAAFWKRLLSDPPAALSLGDLPPSSSRSFTADTAYLRIEGARFAALKQLARDRRVTLFQLLLGTVATLVGRLGRQLEFLLSIPYASQGLGRHPALMSDGVLDLPLRVALADDRDVLGNLPAIRSVLMDALEHPLMTQGLAARLLALPSRGDRPPLTGVYFNLNPRVVLDGFAPLRASMREGRKPGLLSELMFNFYEEDEALALDLHHSTEFFSPGRIREILEALDADIGALTGGAPASPAATSPTASDASTPSAFGQAMPARDAALGETPRIERWISAQAQRSADRIAISAGEEHWTYGQLEAQANRIAQTLQARGVRPGDWVGLCLPRGPQLIAALLGILKCGAAYVPLDPAFPLQRLRDMIEDAGLRLLLSDSENAARLEVGALETLRIDLDAAEIRAAAGNAPRVEIRGDAPAYVIYTSGSTGKPKGVVVLQRGVANFLRSMAHTPGMRGDDRILAVTTLSFDIAVLELLLPLCLGARIVLAQRTDAIDGQALRQLIERHRVSIMQATPSTWHLLLEAGFRAPQGFRALCGGEALSPALARRLLDCGVDQLWNMYGPTETTVWSTVSQVTDAQHISVGRPIDDTVVRLLDDSGQECGVGEPGEICIGGAGVAQGYHARPELTAERFIADPFDASPGARLYRTGDLGAWNEDGTIRHMGRLDHQVKLRGYRIELGEIEARLEQVPGVARAAMRVESFGEMDDRLVAYAVPAPGQALPALAALRRELGRHLPDYMLPQVLRELAEMPLLPNGKIDRKSLGAELGSAASAGAPASAPVAATPQPADRTANDASLVIAAEMGRLLGQEGFSPSANFFEQGGHSLLAAELAAAIKSKLGVRPSLRTLFESPTPLALAAALGATRSTTDPAPPGAAEPRRREDRRQAPLSVQQLRAWFLEQTAPHGSVNLLPSAHRLIGVLDVDAFRRALRALVSRQSVLRSVFLPSNDGVVMEVREAFDPSLPMTDLSGLAREVAESRVRDIVAGLQAEPLDLGRGPPFRAALLRMGDEEHVFVFVVHHLVWDGWSFDLLYRDMAELYQAELGGGEGPAPLELEYGDYSAWQRELLASDALQPQIAHWRQRLLPAPAPLALPLDHPRPPEMSGRGASVRLVLPPEQLERLHRLARTRGTTVFVILLTAYVAMLQRLTGQRDLIVGTPVRGREHAALLPVMGFFVNALPLRFDAPLSELEPAVEAVKAVVSDALGHPDVPVEALVRELKLPRDSSRPALFQTLFSFQDVRERPRRWGPLRHERVGVPVGGSSHELSLWCVETAVGLETIFTFAADLFAPDTIRGWAMAYQRLLGAIDQEALSGLLAALSDSSPDRSSGAVPAPSAAAPTRVTESAPQGAARELLRAIWKELLAVDSVSDDDNFFELGGHSLLALTMVGRVEVACGKRLSLLRVGDSSLGALAAELEAGEPRREPEPALATSSVEATARPAGRRWMRRLLGRE